MKTIKVVLLCIISIITELFSVKAFCADWKLFFVGQDKTKSYIDSSSVVVLPDGKIRAWQVRQGSEKDFSKNIKSLVEVDCKERKYTVRAIDCLNEKDPVLRSALYEVEQSWSVPHQQWEYLGTSDFDEATFNTWCSITK